jgi:hypothetical protein
VSDDEVDLTSWMEPIADLLQKIAPQVVKTVDKTTALRGTMVQFEDGEVMVNAAALVRNVLFDSGIVNDPVHLGEHMGIGLMSQDALAASLADSEARLLCIQPVLPFAFLLTQIVIAAYVQAERITGILPPDLTYEQEVAFADRLTVAAWSSVKTVLSFLQDTQDLVVRKKEDDE